MKKYLSIIGIVFLVILAGFIVFSIWNMGGEKERIQKGSYPDSESSEITKKGSFPFDENKLPAEAPAEFREFVRRLDPSFVEPEIETDPGITPEEQDIIEKPEMPQKPPEEKSVIDEPEAQPEIVISIEENEEIFNEIYPEFYRDQLSSMQDSLVNEGIIKESERVAFESEDEIFWFVEIGFIYLKDTNVIKEKDLENFLNIGLPEWKRINHLEASLIKQGILSSSQNNESSFFDKNDMSQQNSSFKLSGISSIISSCSVSPFSTFYNLATKLIFGEKAEAQVYVCTPLECYQEGAGIGPLPGVNLIAPCCCCLCGGSTPVPCGCLNAVCAGRNAIWDPVTGICGCDI